MENDRETNEFWSTFAQSLAEGDPKDDLYSEITSPIMVMSKDYQPDVWKALEDGEKEGGEKEEDAIRESKIFGKRQQTNEARSAVEKRRRADIRNKIEDLKVLTNNCKKRDLATTLDCVIDHIHMLKFQVEDPNMGPNMGPILPLPMGMHFPTPWYPFMIPPVNFMTPFNGFIQGETNSHHQQIVPFTTDQGVNNQPKPKPKSKRSKTTPFSML